MLVSCGQAHFQFLPGALFRVADLALQIPYLAPAEQVLPVVPTLLDFSGGMADGCQVLRVTSAR